MGSSNDVTVLFPDRERKQRTQRGMPSRSYILPPSYEEMVRSAFNILLMDRQEQGRTIVTFFLVSKENKPFGYLKITEDKEYPIGRSCESYRALQYLYDDVCSSVWWYSSLEELIIKSATKPTARIKNETFIKQIKDNFQKYITI